MPAPETIKQLVARFTDQREDYRSGRYNETQLRRDFLDPFFDALGWDVSNRKNYSEKFREVVHEVSVEVDGAAKAADYAFQTGGHVHFFIEAKKPAVNIESNPEPAFQIRRYGWSAKLNVSLLSDFEQLAVYDCRQKPVHGDPAHVGRANLYSFTEYIDKWDEIAGLVSYEAVHQGSLDKFTDSLKGKRGTADVDDAFLAEMEHWREELARVIALRNNLSQRQINTAVQLIIDRIIFLRICEDRGIEPENGLREATDGIDVYGDLMELFKKADKKYNSGLFHFEVEKGQSSHPDTLTPTLKIDDKVFKDILANLYLPKSPYAFNYFSAEILGQVYERFLGKVIRLTAGGHAKVEEKPEVRKAGGVYYTPAYIVEYIVKNTVGELLKDKTPADLQADPIRIVDPACGSGSFLLGAYQFLLDWTLNWYIANDPAKWAKGKNPPIYEGDKAWQLTMEKKKELLTSHIFGVDIDAQAVEVTKLSLLLKVVENPGQLDLFGERILPDLGENIKCGNSLIGPDYYDNQQLTMFDSEEQYRVNAFDWHRSFPKAFAKGGFDAVIGNPPYGQVVNEAEKVYFGKKYIAVEGRFDTFELFIEKGLNIISNSDYLGFIVPSPLLSNLYSRKLRQFILEKSNIQEITNFGINVFADPTIHTCIIILSLFRRQNHYVRIRKQINEISELFEQYDFEISQDQIGKSQNSTFDVFIDKSINDLLITLNKNSLPLGEICFIRQCIKTGNDDIYVKRSESILPDPWKLTLRGRSIARYEIITTDEYVKYGNWLARNWQNKTFYETQKIAIRETGKTIVATLDLDNRYLLSSLYAIYFKNTKTEFSLKYILGILNSKLATSVAKIFAFNLTEGAFTKIRTNQLARLPIRTINFSDPTDVARHDRMVALVESMLNLHKQSAAARLPDEKDRLARQIEQTDRQIDKLVYELYGLSEEEIKIVEGG